MVLLLLLQDVILIMRVFMSVQGKKTVFFTAATVIFLLFFAPLFSLTFTETFNSETYKHTTNTTANWDTLNGRAMLTTIDKFSETTRFKALLVKYEPSYELILPFTPPMSQTEFAVS